MPSAFAEAVGGAIGALWTTVLFYPVDVAKIRLQAEADADEEDEEEGGQQHQQQHQQQQSRSGDVEAGEGGSTVQGGEAAALVSKGEGATPPAGAAGHKGPKTFFGEVMVVLRRPDLWYAGLGLKMQLSIIATFVYFYVYTSFKRAYSRVFKRPVSFLPNLALASLAGVVNILVTMPMDVVVTRMQVAPHGQKPTFREMVRTIWEEGGAAAAAAAAAASGGNKPQADSKVALFWRLARFWHGLLPALILTSNPAINYAMYDAVKALVPIPPGKKRHGPRETFAVGMLSKFVATVITYPLIRAKVMMMADTKRSRRLQPHLRAAEASSAAEGGGGGGGSSSSSGGSSSGGGNVSPTTSLAEESGGSGHSPGLSPAESASSSSSPSSVLSPSLQLIRREQQGLLEIMRELVKEGGVRELYVGLDGQVINTALKNAVLLNTKDRISRVTTFLLRRLLAPDGSA